MLALRSVLILLGVLAAGPATATGAPAVPDVFALRLFHPEVIGGSTFRGWVQVYNPHDQRPLAGVTVRAEIEIEYAGGGAEGETRELEGSTDERGEWPIEVEVEVDPGFAQLEVTARASYLGVEREADTWAVSLAAPRVVLSTDKRLYQPGQTLHARGLWLDADGRARAGEVVELELRDPRGRRSWSRQLTTSRFGVAAADWRIPESAAAGDYRLEAEGGVVDVRISRYEMARFGVEVTADRPYYLPGEDSRLTVAVTALDGTPIAGAEVRLEPALVGRRRSRLVPPATARTGDGGRAVLEVDLSAAHQRLARDRGELRDLELEVTATDPLSRRSERAAVATRVSRQPIHVYHLGDLPPVPGVPGRAWVATFYPDGEPAPCVVELRDRGDLPEGRVLARFATGVYGVGRLPATPEIVEAVLEERELVLAVQDAEGRRAQTKVRPWHWEVAEEPVLAVTGRTLFRPGEPLEVILVPSEPMRRVVVELVASGATLASRVLPRIDGPTPIVFTAPEVPLQALRGLLRIRAYPLDRPAAWHDAPMGARSVLYPGRSTLSLAVAAEPEDLRPGGQVRLAFDVDGATEAALAVAIVDRGVELRQGGEGLPGPALFAGLADRDEQEVGGWTLERLLELDVSRASGASGRITADLDLLAEYLLFEPHLPRLEEDTSLPFGDERRDHRALFDRQFFAVGAALHRVVPSGAAPTDQAPRDEASFLELLEGSGIDFAGLRDPWGSPYRVSFTVAGGDRRVDLTSAGRDRTWGTIDDFSAWHKTWRYFQPLGTAVDQALARFFRRTGGFLDAEADLARELARGGVAWAGVRDPWGRPYRLRGRPAGGEYHLEVRSHGPQRGTGAEAVAWTSVLRWGSEREEALRGAVERWLEAGNAFPAGAREVRAALAAAGLEPETWRDPGGRPLAFEVGERVAVRDRLYHPTPDSAARRETLTERYDEIRLLAAGGDGRPGTGEYRVVGRLSRLRGAGPRSEGRETAAPAASGGLGVLAVAVVDEDGFSIPGATVSVGSAVGPAAIGAADTAGEAGRPATGIADAQGEARLLLAPGVYRVKAVLEGFNTVVYDLVRVEQDRVTALTVTLELFEIVEELYVTAEAPALATAAGRPRPERGPPRATPRLRRDFPETLLWLPELTATSAGDGSGRSEVSVRLADALTTWRLAALASTADGRIAVAEAEIPVTQPLSVEPDLPPLLTAGDEVEVPVYLQNRSPQALAVELALEPGGGLEQPRPMARSVAVDGGGSRRLEVPLRFIDPGSAVLRLSARAPGAADAVERAAVVRPAGYQHVEAHNALMSAGRQAAGELEFEVAGAAEPGSARLEVAVDRGVADHLTAAIRGLARRPTGCAEQQTSAALVNLMLLGRDQDPAGAARARANLELARDSLANHAASGGGFAYWPGDEADLALTAYVLDFLRRIQGPATSGVRATPMSLEEPESGVGATPASPEERARRWLLDRQLGDGSWPSPWRRADPQVRDAAPPGDLRLTAWVAHVLSRWLEAGGSGEAAAAVDRALAFLERRLVTSSTARPGTDAAGDPYALAHAVLAGIVAGRDVGSWVAGLRSLERERAGTAYWQLDGSTPFHGWGDGGRLETTAAVVEALLAADSDRGLIDRGLAFLLLEKDAGGLWPSTQATVRALTTLTLALPAGDPPGPAPRVLLDGEPLPSDQPLSLALGRHRLSLEGEAGGWALMRATVRSVVPWSRLREVVPESRSLRYEVDCAAPPALDSGAASAARASGATEVWAGRPVSCRVEVERTDSRGYGMLIAEIGLPPGAEVDRRSLEEAVAVSRGSFWRYEVWSDRVVAYLWPRSRGHHFDFVWRPRLVERAAAAPSVLYDYYNPEARVVLEPAIYRVQGNHW